MGFHTVAETALYIAATLPADPTSAAQFEALTWVRIGEVTDVPSVVGREYNTSNHAPVDSAQQLERKASYKLPNAEIACAWDEDDAGQVMVDEASRSYDVYAFKLEKQDGALRYFTAQVSKFVENNGTVDNVVTGAITLLRQTDTVKVPAP